MTNALGDAAGLRPGDGLLCWEIAPLCGGTTAWRGCSNGDKDERNFYIPKATGSCDKHDILWCCPQNSLEIYQPYKVAKAKEVKCNIVKN
ncbi:hypothetical protein H4Q26_009213 [Puccinia striiformis f. sp. tritici PST-130]|uniref:Uncharacterized protein n=1 Tax=Puccinia striiformis f. sp. tritici PST-78 TaxID=1165861 RepID=A0A0L0VQ88_9BASI|nr:hypothetical protein H4Q26_009213 [Puccinia striiformis f. sp. tritici PST-130]KNF01165.1 hypothetical protein PSTG_05519 [Puccinia striiformis f. sp. tritici PST-78]